MSRPTKAKRRTDSKDREIEKLWADFADVPMNPETECMEADFLHFPAGTHREEIWRWFDEKHSKGVHFLLYGPEARNGMCIDTILAQLASMKDNAQSFIVPEPADPEAQEIWKADVEACEAATAILSALQDEGIKDPEEVRDLIADYNALAQQYQALHRKFEAGDKPDRLAGVYLCPECKRQSRPGNAHCWNCGHKLNWR